MAKRGVELLLMKSTDKFYTSHKIPVLWDKWDKTRWFNLPDGCQKNTACQKKTTQVHPKIYIIETCHIIHKTNNNNLILVSKTKQSNYITRKYVMYTYV